MASSGLPNSIKKPSPVVLNDPAVVLVNAGFDEVSLGGLEEP